MSAEVNVLTLDARRVLGLDQRTLGDLLGASRRTVQRWDSNQAHPTGGQLAQLAAAVHPHDAALATKLATAAETTLEKLGIVKPPPVVAPAPSPPPSPRAPPPVPHLVDVVVCAAAEALNTPPPAVRPVLLAAFRRAREVGLRVEDVEKALSDAIEKKGNARTGKRRP